MSDLIIHCEKGRLKVVGHSVEMLQNNLFQVKAFKWLPFNNKWTEQARYHTFPAYDVEGVHCDKDGNSLN